jgi:hypothetical protein
MTIVEVDRAVTGGVDTHLDIHAVAALDPRGALLGRFGYQRGVMVASRSQLGLPA